MFNELIKKSCTSTKNGYNNYLDAKLHLHNVFLPSPAIHLLLCPCKKTFSRDCVEINRDNVSEILQIYMEGHSEQKEVAMLAFSLRTKPFQAHSPSQKASVLAFLVNELCCSKAVIR